jgi:hypothetical protein
MLVCTVPRNSKEFGRLHDLEQRLFGDLAFPLDIASEIFEMRPEIFNAVVDRDGNVAAYSSAFMLRPEWGTALTRGDITGAELRPHMIYQRNDRHTDVHLYIGSVVVDPKYDPIRKCILLSSLMWFRVQQLRAASVESLCAIMTTASGQGERLARRLGAKKLNDRANCRDGLDVFGAHITVDLFARAVGAVEGFPFGKTVWMNLDFTSYAGANLAPARIEMPYDLPLAA